jgi:hypothetical protein
MIYEAHGNGVRKEIPTCGKRQVQAGIAAFSECCANAISTTFATENQRANASLFACLAESGRDLPFRPQNRQWKPNMNFLPSSLFLLHDRAPLR